MKAVIYDAQFLSGAGIEAVLRSSDDPYEIIVLDPGKKLLSQVESHQPDLLILEYIGPYPIQVETIAQIKKKFPNIKILIISEDDDTIEIKRRIALGIDGFLTKKCSQKEISLTIDTIAGGGKFYCQRVIDIMTNQDEALNTELSERELQVIRLISKGLTSTEMADKLNLSIHTINSHRKNILKKLGFKSPAELIAYAIKKIK